MVEKLTPPEKVESSPFPPVLKNLSISLEQLRDFVGLIEPLLDRESEKATTVNEAGILKEVADALDAARSNPTLPTLDAVPDPSVPGAPAIVVAKGEGDSFHLLFKSGKAMEFQRAFAQATKPFLHRSHLYNSSLVSLASAAEIYFGNLVGAFFRLAPDAVDVSESPLTYAQLASFGSIEDARAYLLDRKIESVLRDNVEAWLKFAREKLKLSMGYLDPHKDELTEIFQRRNLLVHAGGRVNRIYIANTTEAVRAKVQPGDMITVSREYLLTAIDRIELIFMLMGAELWKRFEPKKDLRSTVIVDMVLEHLKAGRFWLAEGLSKFGAGDKGLPERSQLVSRINQWQALKWLGRFSEVEAEVREIDFSAKAPVFSLAKEVLLDNFDAAFAMIPDLVKAGEVALDDLKTWPLFRDLRHDPRYEAIQVSLEGTTPARLQLVEAQEEEVPPAAATYGESELGPYPPPG